MSVNVTNGRVGGSPAGARANGSGALGKSDFQSSSETRWCPGCGDYAILATLQEVLAEQGTAPEQIAFVSGIGCAGRFPYYMNTYGVHGIHGRAPAFATGLALTREDLQVWVIGGDGDMLSIGASHLLHALRRDIPIKIVLFNNQIYGLTKGQISPTSEVGKITKSTPFGSLDIPFQPLSLALGAEASFVARTIDRDRKHLASVMQAAAAHPGAAFVEVYQNCPVFNDGAYAALTDKESREANLIRLEHGAPIRFGRERERGVMRGPDGDLVLADVSDVGEGALLVHNAHCPDPSLAFALSRLAAGPSEPTPVGVFRKVARLSARLGFEREAAAAREGFGERELDELLRAGDTWTVG
ncbi:MAG: 2-oxoacid:ferredoxin oxidoreductase subunit beta [Solirubrobacteraceae bacterium]